MKRVLFFSFLLFSFLSTSSHVFQNVPNYFRFESQSDLSAWKVLGGKIEISSMLYKEGMYSLRWNAQSNSKLEVTLNDYYPSAKQSAFFSFFNKEGQKGIITIRFMGVNNETIREAHIDLNFRGWRDFDRSYDEFAQTTKGLIHKIQFSYQSSNASSAIFYIDDMNFSNNVTKNEHPECFVSDFSVLNPRRSTLLSHYLLHQSGKLQMLAGDVKDLQKLRKGFKFLFPSDANSDDVVMKVEAMHLTRNADGVFSGSEYMSPANMTAQDMTAWAKNIELLANAAQKSKSDRKTFELYLDYLFDQGVFYSLPKLVYSDYNEVRAIPASLLKAAAVCNDKQKIELLGAIRWMVEFNLIYAEGDQLKSDISSDYIYNYLPYLYQCILLGTDDNTATAEMKVFSAFLGNCSEYTSGGEDLFKPDGTSFHHKSHYNGYMYSFKTWVEYLSKLKGTSFRISENAYNRIKAAVTSLYLMSTRGKEGSQYYANSLSGRHPFTGMQPEFSQKLFKDLIAIGGDILHKDIDTELASKYNYFFKVKDYNVPEINLDGFYQFNYSPIGVYRKDNWVVTMRCPTTKFWGSEIYARTNRLGRYASHGSLEALYEGSSTLASGYPAILKDVENTGGWDWNVMPGTTTVFYDNYRPMMPNGNVTDRFDQYSKTTNYSGALSWGDKGMFSAEFDQGDNWGSQRYIPTNLKFKKTVFAFDGLLIDMGSGISSNLENNTTRITATNLFQNIVDNSGNGGYTDNGKVEYSKTLTLKNDITHWILSPVSTGFVLPAKINEDVTLIFNEQKTPHQIGTMLSKPDSKMAAKAYISHGLNPVDGKYLFVVLPAATPDKLNQLKQQIDEGKLYTVLSSDTLMHAIHYLPADIFAYSCFKPTAHIKGGFLQSVSSQALVMERYDKSKKELSLAVCNPNLNPETKSDGSWVSTPTSCKIVLNGLWAVATADTNRIKISMSNGTIVLDLILYDGNPMYIQLKAKY